MPKFSHSKRLKLKQIYTPEIREYAKKHTETIHSKHTETIEYVKK